MTNQTARTLCPYSLAPEVRPQVAHWTTCSAPMAWVDVSGLTSLFSAPLYLAGSYSAKVTVEPLVVEAEVCTLTPFQGPLLHSGQDTQEWQAQVKHRLLRTRLARWEARRAPASVRLLISSAPASVDPSDLVGLLAYARKLLARVRADKKNSQASKKGAVRASLTSAPHPLTRDEAREALRWLSRQERIRKAQDADTHRQAKRVRQLAEDRLLELQVLLAAQNGERRIAGQTSPDKGSIWTGNPKRERVAPRKVKRAGLNLSLLS